MKVVFIGSFDPAGVSQVFSDSINRYTEHKAKNILVCEGGLGYKTDLESRFPPHRAEIEHWLKTADVIQINPAIKGAHKPEYIHDDGEELELWPSVKIKDLANPKAAKVAYFHGSTSLRKNYERYARDYRAKGWKIIGATPDHVIGMKCDFFPFLIDLEDEVWDQPYFRPAKLLIQHAPTDRPIKNTEEIKKANSELHGIFDLRIIEGTKHDRCIELKLSAHAAFDHMQGYYGLNSIENPWLEQVNLVGPEDYCLKIVREFTGAEALPWTIVKNYESLRNTIKLMANNMEWVRSRGRECRKWIKLHWNNGQLIHRLIELWPG